MSLKRDKYHKLMNMISPQTLIQLKAYSRIDGAILAATWAISMWFMFKVTESIWGPILMLSTPFFIIWRLKEFRNKVLDGTISFRRALAYSCYVFFYASVLFALVQYIYFAYLDKGSFMQLLTQSINTLKPFYETQGVSANDLDIALKTMKMMKPIDLVFTFMMQNLMIGAMVSPVIALIVKKKQ